jgi:gas vesicle protein
MTCVQEWVTAVIGLVGAGVGAGAAMWGAQRAARASREALAVQIRKEDERWKRDQRQVAYHALITADMSNQQAAHAAWGFPADQLPPEVEAACDAARRESFAALSLIHLCGPESLLNAAEELRDAGDAMLLDSGLNAARRHKAALVAFRSEARRVLGYESMPLQIE